MHYRSEGIMRGRSSRCTAIAATHNARLLLRESDQSFSAAHSTERAVIDFLVRSNVTLQTVVDVGAAPYTFRRSNTADESGLQSTFRQLGPSAHYYGFEPGSLDFRNLQRIAATDRTVPAGHHHLYQLAVAGTPGMKRLLGEPTWRRQRSSGRSKGPWIPHWSEASSPNTHTTNPRLDGLHQYRPVGWVNATTLDIFARHERLRVVDFVKVDTEGTEREVLLEGAAELMHSRRLRTILWEYADKVRTRREQT